MLPTFLDLLLPTFLENIYFISLNIVIANFQPCCQHFYAYCCQLFLAIVYWLSFQQSIFTVLFSAIYPDAKNALGMVLALTITELQTLIGFDLIIDDSQFISIFKV